MNKTSFSRFISRALTCLSVLAAIGAASAASAAIITVTNPGFVATVNGTFTDTEDSVTYHSGDQLPLNLYVNTLNNASTGDIRYINGDGYAVDGNNQHVTATVTGWLPTAVTAGVANFSGLGETANLVTVGSFGVGNNVGFTQTLTGNVQLTPNTTYTLSMEVRSSGLQPSASFTADLTLNGAPVGGSLQYVQPTFNSPTPSIAVVTYTTGASPQAGNLGIYFAATDNSGPATKLLVDNVTLVATPEPASLSLVALAGLAALRRRRQD
jgi:hypothetical protein